MVTASEVLTSEDTEFYQETEALEFVLDLDNRKTYWRLNGHPIKLVSLSEFGSLDQRSIRDTSQFFKFIPPDQIKPVDGDYIEIPGYTTGFGLVDSMVTAEGRQIVRVVNPFVLTRMGAFTNHGINLEGENGALAKEFPIKIGDFNAVEGYEDAYILIQGNTRKLAIEEMAKLTLKAAKELQKLESSNADQDAIESARAYLNLTLLEFDPIPVSFIEDDDLVLSNLTWLQTAVNNTVMPHRYSQRKLAIEYWNNLASQGVSKGEADRKTAQRFGVSVGTIAQWKALLSFPPVVLELIDGGSISSATATKFNSEFNKYVADGLVPISQSLGSVVKDAYAYHLSTYNLITNASKKKPAEVMTLKQLREFVQRQDWYKEALEKQQQQETQSEDLEDDFDLEGDEITDTDDQVAEPKTEYTIEDLREMIPQEMTFLSDLLKPDNQPNLLNALMGAGDYTIKDKDIRSLYNKIDSLKAFISKATLVSEVVKEQPKDA